MRNASSSRLSQLFLLVGESEQVEDRHAAGQRLGHALHHLIALRPREADRARLQPARVHHALDGAEQPRRVLDLVDHEGRRELADEQHGITVGALTGVEVIEIDVGVPGGAAVQE